MTRPALAATCGLLLSASGVALDATPQRVDRDGLQEEVDVVRVLVDARVVDDDGEPILGLGPDDFAVTIDDRPAPVESATWMGGADGPLPTDELTGLLDPTRRRRLVIFVVQKSLVRWRVTGLLRVLQLTESLVAHVRPGDLVAVLSFDTHFRIWLDFTDDLDRVRTVLADEVMFGTPGSVERSREVSIVERLSQAQGRDTHTIEEALQGLGDALEPLPEAKSVILIGYGFGQLTRTRDLFGNSLDRDYAEARDALQRARAAVFSLDVTDADFHTFEHGLRTVSDDTGGFFARTRLSVRRAVDRVANVLTGHYVLFVERPDLEPGEHEIEVELVGREGEVFARRGFVD